MYEKAQKDGVYRAKRIKATKAEIDGYKPNKRLSFGQSTWLGFMRSTAPSQLPAGYGTIALNIYPNATYYEKPLGYAEVGRHITGSINLNDYKGLIAGEIFIESLQPNPALDKQSERGLFKLIKSKSSNETEFYTLNNFGIWNLAQPFADYWTVDKDGKPTPNGKAEKPYQFKGDKFSFVVWKNTLYLCSGKEDFIGSNGKANGLMKWDGSEWDSIDTGKAGFLKNPFRYVNKSAFNSSIDIIEQSYRLYDSSLPFNPSLIVLFKERLLISGAEANPIQVKMSEWNNPDNFVDNVLGLQTAPLTSKDSARASSFIISTGSDLINSMNVFNDTIYIGTNKGFFIYTLVQQNIGNNVQFQLDAVTENNYTLAGSTNSYSTVSFQNKLFYLSNYHVIPELSAFELTYRSSASTTPYAAYMKLSDSIDDFMYKVDLTNSCIGVYGDRVLIGCKYGNSDLSNNITIMASPFAIDANSIRWGYVVLDYIQPNYFFQNNRGCYFTSDESGRLYKIIPTKFGVEVQEQDDQGQPLAVQYPASVFQTGWTGYDPAKDSSISEKSLEKLLLFGYFSEGTEIKVTFIMDKGCEKDTEFNTKTIIYKCTVPDVFDEKDCDLATLMNTDIGRRYGAKNYAIHWNFPKSEDMIIYKRLSIRIDIENSRYFMVENMVGVAQELTSDGNAGITNPKFIDIEFGLSSGC